MLGIPAAALEDPVAALHPRANLMRGAALIEQAHTRYRRDALRALGAYRHSSARQARALGAAIEALAQRLEASDSQAPVRRIAGRANAQALLGCVPSARREVAAVIVATAKRYGVEPAFALAIARRESAFNQAALSPKQARGVMQLIPATAKRYGVDAHDLHQNIDGGVRYLRDLLAMFEGDLRLVAAGYNAGEGAVRRFGHQVPPYRETQTYVPLVLQAREAFLQCQSL
ncbi:MAG: lytic transglycosylase [Chromatiaceae bacterium]|nr:MAG: lytic transglycosylase [Chromatiaceae bacterium]